MTTQAQGPQTAGGPQGTAPKVGVVMGSQSDWATMKKAATVLDELGVQHEARIVSAHRTPDLLYEYAEAAAARGQLGAALLG